MQVSKTRSAISGKSCALVPTQLYSFDKQKDLTLFTESLSTIRGFFSGCEGSSLFASEAFWKLFRLKQSSADRKASPSFDRFENLFSQSASIPDTSA